MKNTQIKFIVLWFFLIITFSIFAIILLLEANGYKFNRETWRLESTGVIIINGLPRQVEVSLNNVPAKDNTLPVKFAKLLPGQYDIVVKKDGYQTWTKTVILTGGQAIEDDQFQLFLAEISPIESTRKLELADIQESYLAQGKLLTLKNQEIWFDEELITRFSQAPAGAILTPNRGHIIFQMGKEIRVMDIDGSNNLKLIDLPTAEEIAFAFSGDKLIYASNGKFWEAKIK